MLCIKLLVNMLMLPSVYDLSQLENRLKVNCKRK